ncbi:MAG: cytochrome b N-terminal domain-containing protein [Candidatus Aminicenantes bacterium]|nr:cytochrome b N-terminal domain-containing protein [Candidatus Aminicenantes bacterium]
MSQNGGNQNKGAVLLQGDKGNSAQSEVLSKSARIKRITQNFFFHIHSPKAHPYSLKPTYTFGLGIMLGFLFLILVVTGVLLMMYYTPSVERAYTSVKDIVFIVKGGRYIRNVHRWAGYGMVIVGFLHLMRTFYTGSYLKRRTLNWIIGVVLLLVLLLSNFSGYLLPWDQLAYWAVTIGSNIAASARELTDALGITQYFDPGGVVKSLLIGGETVGQAALSRFFMLHVILLPLTFLILTSWHFWRIRKDGGLSRPENADEMFRMYREQSPTTQGESSNSSKKGRIDVHLYSWPTLMWAELAVLALVCAVLIMCAFFFDAPLKEQANPMLPENPAKSPWYFLGIQELVSYSAFAGGVIIPILFIFFLVSIPFKDKEDQHIGVWFSGNTGKRITLYSLLFAALVTVGILFVNVKFGWLGDWFGNIPQLIIILVNPATVLTLAFIFWSSIVKRKYGSTRYTAMALFTCAMVSFVILTAVGILFRGPNWEFYWLKSQWPPL